jgi:2-keto-4-pentenoate hydratase/2-oxohepta-3-ene-1,7-dioic acid hydratase in catechol pathway
VPKLVSFISNVMTLLPGDVIATGTPEGIGPMQPDDVVEVKIEGIGTLKNTVAKA